MQRGLAARLGEVDLFRGLDEDTRERIVSGGATITYRPGQVIVEQGRVDRNLYLILDGDVVVEVNGQQAGTKSDGDYFGEMALLDGSPRSATVRAGENGAKAYTISALTLDPVLRNPDVMRQLLIALVARVRDLQSEQPTAVDP